jgi:hypothetical protein
MHEFQGLGGAHLYGDARRISLGSMPRKPRVVSPEAIEIADMIDRVIAARLGPNSTFAEREAAAAAIEVELLAELARREATAGSPKDKA